MTPKDKRRIKKKGSRVKPANNPIGKKGARLSAPIPNIVFSFEKLEIRHPHLCTCGIKDGFTHTMMKRLCDLSRMKSQELKTAINDKSLRFHSFSWEQVEQPFREGFPVKKLRPTDEEEVQPWQFALTANKHGRVFGFFDRHIFYVVWIDPHHKVNPKRS